MAEETNQHLDKEGEKTVIPGTGGKGKETEKKEVPEASPTPEPKSEGAPESQGKPFKYEGSKKYARFQAYMKHAFPHLESRHKRWAEKHEKKHPKQDYAAGAAGPGLPGATDVAPPAPVKPKEEEPQTMSRSSVEEHIQYKRLEEEVAQLRAMVQEANSDKVRAQCYHRVDLAIRDGYDIDQSGRDQLVGRLMSLPDDKARDAEMIFFLDHCRRVPRGQQVAPHLYQGAGPQPMAKRGPTPEQHSRAVSIATKEEISYDDALKKVRQGA